MATIKRYVWCTRQEAEAARRYKSAIDEAAAEWICPITLDLPVDPVMAEDGRVYEREAIEEHIRRAMSGLRSPTTNERIGPKLVTAVQVRNTLEVLVKSGAIGGEQAALWKKRIQDGETVAEIRRRAEGGDVEAMSQLATLYYIGWNGVKEDNAQAYAWYARAADHGHPKATLMQELFLKWAL